MDTSSQIVCKGCQQPGTGKYCSQCGESLQTKRISLSNLFHEVIHFFTHLDKGIGHTLSQLFLRPGHMQREYIDGRRKDHQKPFSFFFLSATVTGLSLYWINILLKDFYGAGNMKESAFFHQYMIFLLVLSLPYFTLVTWLFFYKAGYNLAEIGVLLLYTMSIFFLMVIFSNCTKFLFPSFQTRNIELPLILGYAVITNINFFQKEARWKVIVKSLLAAYIFFKTVTFIQDWIVERYFNV